MRDDLHPMGSRSATANGYLATACRGHVISINECNDGCVLFNNDPVRSHGSVGGAYCGSLDKCLPMGNITG